MNEARKRAYRSLLYYAMLDIRLCQWGAISFNPRVVWRRYQMSCRAGALADWLHNLALHSQDHFVRFREEDFWKGYERFRNQFLEHHTDYKKKFDEELERTSSGV